jgi:transposase
LLLTKVGCPANSDLNFEQFQQLMCYLPAVEQFMSWDGDGSGKLNKDEVKQLAKWMLQDQSSTADKSRRQRLKVRQGLTVSRIGWWDVLHDTVPEMDKHSWSRA